MKGSLVILAPSFYPNMGGVEKHLEKVSERLIQEGWKVTVFVRYSPDFPKTQTHHGITIVRMPKSNSSKTLWLWYLRNKRVFDESTAIHSHDYFPFALRKLIKNKRWVHTFHGYEGYPLDPRAIESRKQVATSVDHTFCVGQFIEKWYDTKCDEVLWGAAETYTGVSKKPKWDFIFYGRFEEDTGFEQYMEGFALIQKAQPKCTLLVLGYGAKEAWAKDYVAKHNLNASFHKPVSDVRPFLLQSKVAFVSGYLAIIECGLAKKPIVAYYGTPIKEDYLKCHPEAGAFAIVNSPQQIARRGIEALEPNPKEIQKLYNWSRAQTWDKIVDQYEKAYQQ